MATYVEVADGLAVVRDNKESLLLRRFGGKPLVDRQADDFDWRWCLLGEGFGLSKLYREGYWKVEQCLYGGRKAGLGSGWKLKGIYDPKFGATPLFVRTRQLSSVSAGDQARAYEAHLREQERVAVRLFTMTLVRVAAWTEVAANDTFLANGEIGAKRNMMFLVHRES